MDNSILEKNIKKLVSQRNSFLFFSAVLAFAVVLLCILLFSKSERIVVVPTNGASFWLEEKRVSNGYVEKMGLFLSDLLLNRSPSDIDKKNQIILDYVHPSFFHDFRKNLIQEKESVLKGNQSYFFRPEHSYVASEDVFVIEGEFLVFVGKNGDVPFCAQQSRKKYTLGFCCQNGKLLLTSLKKEEA